MFVTLTTYINAYFLSTLWHVVVILPTWHVYLASLCISSETAFLFPSVLSLILSCKLTLFSYWPVSFFIKPISETYLRSVKEYSTRRDPCKPLVSPMWRSLLVPLCRGQQAGLCAQSMVDTQGVGRQHKCYFKELVVENRKRLSVSDWELGEDGRM